MHFKTKVRAVINDKNFSCRKEKRDEKNQLYFISKQLLQQSSIYAVSQLGRCRNPYRKLIWLFILTCGLIASIYQAYRFLRCFLQYPVVVNVQVEQKWHLDFPAITICNLNRMKKTYENCLNLNISLENCLHPFILGSGRGISRVHHLAISERRTLHACTSELSGKLDKEKNIMVQFLMNYLVLDKDRRKAIGYQGKEFIQKCSFNGQSCSAEDFEEFQNLHYGNCFTFNKNNHSAKTLKISHIGDWTGLELTLDMKHREYMEVSNIVGARVVIHNPKEDPNPEERGLDISPGFETSVALMQSLDTRLPSPYRDHCMEYKNLHAWPYHENQNSCIRNCIQDINFDTCGCIDPTWPSKTSQKPCNLTDSTEMCCLDNALNLLLLKTSACNCPPPCSSTYYREKISVSKWPSKAAFFKGKEATDDDVSEFKSERQSKAKLKIFYLSLLQKIYEQKPMFHKPEIFSHLGGELGLWLGMSLMVIFELFETAWHLIKHFVKWIMKFNNQRK
ncbi:acid-sensing ion channel 4-A [Nephila pilipes]|uniref:Acid-sensing ion channel 4-A n=1 Tax=Nephila pilipes TaxID=299642 RepID=A0A8X6U1D6_NEPPI|nr:acid-sensing ion channel 4-A [Nephila pilipes]